MNDFMERQQAREAKRAYNRKVEEYSWSIPIRDMIIFTIIFALIGLVPLSSGSLNRLCDAMMFSFVTDIIYVILWHYYRVNSGLF